MNSRTSSQHSLKRGNSHHSQSFSRELDGPHLDSSPAGPALGSDPLGLGLGRCVYIQQNESEV